MCKRCVLDESCDLQLDKEGICQYCRIAERTLKENAEESKNLVDRLLKIKGDKYDCLIGMSGGVDSATALHYAVKLGLRPLVFSMDNGYNDPRADENILRMVEKLKVPFQREVIDLDRFKDLQTAFLKSGVKNVEIPTDHILMALSYKIASQYGIKWIISGANSNSESIMPPEWGYNARDLVHIKDIYKKITGKNLKGLPTCGLLKWNYYKWVRGIQHFYLLDYLKYDRIKSEKMLEKEYGFKSTGEKHEENYFTRWFQSFYLFEKFGIDKRKAHFSSLINSGQMTREEAIEKLKEYPIYPKFGIEQQVLRYPKREYNYYKQDEKLWNLLATFIRQLRKLYRKLTQIGQNIRG